MKFNGNKRRCKRNGKKIKCVSKTYENMFYFFRRPFIEYGPQEFENASFTIYFYFCAQSGFKFIYEILPLFDQFPIPLYIIKCIKYFLNHCRICSHMSWIKFVKHVVTLKISILSLNLTNRRILVDYLQQYPKDNKRQHHFGIFLQPK